MVNDEDSWSEVSDEVDHKAVDNYVEEAKRCSNKENLP